MELQVSKNKNLLKNIKNRAYKSGKTMGQCRGEARKNKDTTSRNSRKTGILVDENIRSNGS
jgi:hypothetical protein